MAESRINTSRFDWVDGLKAWAILGILLNHFVEVFGPGPWFSNPSYDWPPFLDRISHIFPDGNNLFAVGVRFLGWLGDMGPGVFILLSGFALTWSQLRNEKTAGNFYRTKLIRIFPLYITIHLIVLVFALLVHSPANINIFSPKVLLSLMGLRFTDSLFFYINPSWWFIWLIIQLYIVFPLLFKVLINRSIPFFVVLTISITIISRLAGLLNISYSNNLYYWMTGIFAGTRLFEFTVGMVFAKILASQPDFEVLLNKPIKIFLFSLVFYCSGFVCSWTYVGSLFSNMLITLGLSGIFYSIYKITEGISSTKKILLFIGKNSFSVFLLHQPFIYYFGNNLHGMPKVLVILSVLIMCFPVGYVIEKLVNHSIKIFADNYNRIEPFIINKIVILSIYLMTLIIILGNTASLVLRRVISPYINLLAMFYLFMLVVFLVVSYNKYKKIEHPIFVLFFIVCSVFYSLLPGEWIQAVSIALLLGIVLFYCLRILLKPLVTIIISIILIVAFFISIESYFRKSNPMEISIWGEIPALQPDKRTVYSLIPNKTTHLKYNNYDYFLRTNNMGFTSPNIDLTKKDTSIYRIFIVGDAFSMPEGVEYSYSYPSILEKELKDSLKGKNIQVINGGVTGYGPNEMLAQIKNYIDTIKPDLIINEFFINEFLEVNINAKQRLENIGFGRQESKRLKFFGYSQIVLHFEKLLRKVSGRIDHQYNYNKSLLNLYRKDSEYYSDTVINKLDTYFQEVKTICNKNNTDIWLLYVPGQIEVSSEEHIEYYPQNENIYDTNKYNLELSHKIIYLLCEKHDINLLDTKDLLKNYPNQPVYFEESWHWNREGHRFVAYMLTKEIITKRNDERE